MTPQLVQQIVQAREQVEGFVSAEDLSAAAGLPPHLTDEIAAYAVFLS
jgi:DNA uptake protein ComE-like DNA-binding protein